MRVRALLTLCLGMLLAAPCAAQGDLWQVSLNGGTILQDIQLVALNGDDLVVRRGDSTGVVPLWRITELRLVRRASGPDSTGALRVRDASPRGQSEVYQFLPYDISEKRRVFEQIVRQQVPDSAPPR